MTVRNSLVIGSSGDIEEASVGDSIAPTCFTLVCGRLAPTTSLWLTSAGGATLNDSPFKLDNDCELISITCTTRGAFTFDVEVYKNADIMTLPVDANKIANLSVVSSNEGLVNLTPVPLVKGDRVAVFLDGTSVANPHVILWFRRKKE